MAMKWTKSPPELIERFQAALPGAPAVERPMFGYPAAFVGGNMFASLFQEHVVLRLGDEDRASLLKLPGAATFEPMKGRPMREYVTVPPAMRGDGEQLRQWIARAFAYGRSLPPKAAKKPAAKKPAAKKSAAKKPAAKKPAAKKPAGKKAPKKR